jgi:hypothetical protein
VELVHAIGDSGPLEMGISPKRWLRAREGAKRVDDGSLDDRPEVQVRDAKRGLRTTRRAFRLAAWSARWRKWFGGSRRALRIQAGVLWLVAIGVGTAGESLVQGAFRPVYLLAGLVLAMLVSWLTGLSETSLRLQDAAQARAAARDLAGGERALLAGRLASRIGRGVQLVIATDTHVLTVGQERGQPWKQLRRVPYAQITSFGADEKAEPRSVTLSGAERELLLEYLWRVGDGRGDYQSEQRKALLAILERRTRSRAGGSAREQR